MSGPLNKRGYYNIFTGTNVLQKKCEIPQQYSRAQNDKEPVKSNIAHWMNTDE